MRKFSSLALTVASVLASVALGGCASEEGSFDADEDVVLSSAEQPLWKFTGYVPWSSGSVPVCFLSSVPTALRATVRTQVESTWEAAAQLNFWGWDTCPAALPTTNQIVVGVKTLSAGTLGVTSGSSSNPAAGLIYIDFGSTSPSNKTIVHEFGHAIGFHEENSSTSPCTQRSSGATSLEGEGDMSGSVMSQSACNSSSTLSAWDIMGVRQVYGMKAPGSISGLGGLVANIHGGATDFGLPITGWPSVSSAWNEHFVRSSSSSLLLTATSGSTTRCLNIQGGVVSNNWTPLISWDCNESYTNSQFHFTGVAWRAMGNRCVQASSSASGAKLSIQACGSSSLQKWDFFEGNNRIRLNGTNLCATVPSGSTALGTEITLTTCGNSYQTFSYSNGHINYSNVCLNVLGGSTANGNAIGLWNGCTSSPAYVNEQFTIRGPITGMGQCVDMQNGVPSDGVPIGMYPCNSTAAQTWEYFW